MKKYLLVSLAVLLTASFAWTEVTQVKVAEPKVDIEADATVTWGIDFGKTGDDTTKHGFKNEANFKVKVPLIDKQTSTSKGEGAVYAEVDVKDIELYMQAKKGKKGDKTDEAGSDNKDGFDMFGKVGGLSAKFVFYGAYLQIADAPSMKTNFAKIWLPLGIEGKDEYGKNSQTAIDDYESMVEPGFKGYGVKFGYMNKDLMDLDVGLKLVSNGDWEGKFDKYDASNSNKTVHSKYGLGLDLGMKPLKDLLAFNLGFNMTLAKAKDYKNGTGDPADNFTADNLLFGIGAEVTSKPIDGLALTLGFDGGTKGSDFAWDMLFDAKYKWVSAGVYAADIKGNTWWQATNKQNKKTGNVALYLKFETKGKEKDPSFLLKGLDAGVYLGLFDLASYRGSSDNQLPVLLKVWGAYKYNFNDSMWIKPFADVWAESKHKKDSKEILGVAYNLGVTFSPVEKVEITAKWSHGKLDDPEAHAKGISSSAKNQLITHAANTDADNKHDGKLTFAVKVSY